jgi:FKBP-type peptidyl-prolyl cis-trans isomerase 2
LQTEISLIHLLVESIPSAEVCHATANRDKIKAGFPIKFFRNMQQVKQGDKVKVHYHGKLTDGSTFDSSDGRDPLEFEVGSGAVIPGFDNGVIGMTVGDKKTLNIPADEAYGERHQELVMDFPKDRFPEDMNPEVGMQLMMNNGAGQQFPVTIVDVKEDSVTLDANHHLAGQDLVFDIELVDIESKSKIITL